MTQSKNGPKNEIDISPKKTQIDGEIYHVHGSEESI